MTICLGEGFWEVMSILTLFAFCLKFATWANQILLIFAKWNNQFDKVAGILLPALNFEARHSWEIFDVVGDNGGIVAESDWGNHCVVVADFGAIRF